jgi:hypothetical protein
MARMTFGGPADNGGVGADPADFAWTRRQIGLVRPESNQHPPPSLGQANGASQLGGRANPTELRVRRRRERQDKTLILACITDLIGDPTAPDQSAAELVGVENGANLLWIREARYCPYRSVGTSADIARPPRSTTTSPPGSAPRRGVVAERPGPSSP